LRNCHYHNTFLKNRLTLLLLRHAIPTFFTDASIRLSEAVFYLLVIDKLLTITVNGFQTKITVKISFSLRLRPNKMQAGNAVISCGARHFQLNHHRLMDRSKLNQASPCMVVRKNRLEELMSQYPAYPPYCSIQILASTH